MTTKHTFQTHNEIQDIERNGTHLQGYIDISYKELVSVFGQPEDGDGYKIDAEWAVKFSDGTIATIYNYKDGKNYLGKEGTAKTKIRDWHIGGFDQKAVQTVTAALKAAKGE